MNETGTGAVTVRTEGNVEFRRATDAAGMCKQIVIKTAIKLQGRRYVPIEGWQAIAVAHGCIASARDVRPESGGIACIGEVRRIATGDVIATAEGFVGDDEPTWGKRPMYARRGMAQTRAMSRACRSAFAHVVVMMDAGLETTPAEEMTDVLPDGHHAGGRPSGLPTPAPTAPDAPAAKPDAKAGQADATGELMPDGAIDPANLPPVALDYIAAHADTLRDAAGKITDKLAKAIKERPEAFKTAVTGWAKETGWKVAQ
jgi:hypothetical protein